MKNIKTKKIKSFKSFVKKADKGKNIPDDAYETMICGFMTKPGTLEETLEEKIISKTFLPPQKRKHQVPYFSKQSKKGSIPKNREHGGDTEDQLEKHYHWRPSDPAQHEEASEIRQFTQSSKRLNHFLIHQHLSKTNPEAMMAFHKKQGTSPHFFNNPETRDYLQDKDTAMSNALQRHQTPKDLHVYTGMMRNPERYKKVKGVKPAHLPAYTSTSTKQDVAMSFAKRHEGESVHVYKYNPASLHTHRNGSDIVPNAREHHRTIGNPNSTSEERMQAAHALVGSTAYKHIMHIHVPEGSHGAYVSHMSDHPHETEFILHKNARLHIHPSPTIDHRNQAVIWHAKMVHDGIKPTRFADE
jgi:hypothetical protein